VLSFTNWIRNNFRNIVLKLRNYQDSLRIFTIIITIIILLLGYFINYFAANEELEKYLPYLMAIAAAFVIFQGIADYMFKTIASSYLEGLGSLFDIEDKYADSIKKYSDLLDFLTKIIDINDDINQFIKKAEKANFNDPKEKEEIKKGVFNRIKFFSKLLSYHSILFGILPDDLEELKMKVSIYVYSEEKKMLCPVWIESRAKSSYRRWHVEENKNESFIVQGFRQRNIFIHRDWSKQISGERKNAREYDDNTYRSVIVSPIVPKINEVKYCINGELSHLKPIGVIAVSSNKINLWEDTDQNIIIILEICVQLILNLWYNVIERYNLGSVEMNTDEIPQD